MIASYTLNQATHDHNFNHPIIVIDIYVIITRDEINFSFCGFADACLYDVVMIESVFL